MEKKRTRVREQPPTVTLAPAMADDGRGSWCSHEGDLSRTGEERVVRTSPSFHCQHRLLSLASLVALWRGSAMWWHVVVV